MKSHKLEMHTLEDLKIDKLYQVKQLHKEIAKIETAIKEHHRLYLLENKYADECTVVLDGYGRQNVRDILMFFIPTLLTINESYRKAYKGVNITELIDNEEFFDFLIVEIGRATIVDLKKRFEGVITKDNEQLLETTSYGNALNSESIKNRLYKKLTKKSIINEAKRMTHGI